MTRKYGEELTDEHNEACHFLGIKLFHFLNRELQNDRDLILNTLCCSIACLLHAAVDKDDRPVVIQLVHKILTKNNI